MSDIHQYREAITFQQTEEFDDIMRNRSTVERVLSGMVRYNNVRPANYYNRFRWERIFWFTNIMDSTNTLGVQGKQLIYKPI